MSRVASSGDATPERSKLRVLGRIRLSRSTEESTSAERQRELIEQWASANGHTVIGWAEDLDVSGAVSPFDTPALGPWLHEPKLHDWDILVAWKLDRLARRAVPLHRLFGVCQDEGKTIVCVSDNIDLSHWVGRLIASVIAGVAEGELEAIRERTRASRKKLIETGRWPGGKFPYGYRVVPRDGAGWELAVDDDAAAVVRFIASEVLDGRSVMSVCDELNERGELSPSDHIRGTVGDDPLGTKWNSSTVSTMLRSRALLGHVTYQGSTVRDDDGAPVESGPPVLDPETFDKLQRELDLRAKPKTRNRTTNASPLLRVVFCVCGSPLYHQRKSLKGKEYRYYYCREKGHTDGIPAEWLESSLEQEFLSEVGDQEVMEKVYVPASSSRIELTELELSVDELSKMMAGAQSSSVRRRLTEQITSLDRRIAELEQTPEREAETVLRGSGERYSDVWARSTPDERRNLLLKSEITATARLRGRVANQSPGVLEFHLRVPTEIKMTP